MKKSHVPIPEPASRFQKISCNECGETQVVYSHSSTRVMCNSCGNLLSEPTGAKAWLHGSVSETLE